MTILTFPWDDISMANGISVTEICHTARTSYKGGYDSTRVRATKMQKQFEPSWAAMEPVHWLNFIEFWRSVYGSANAFYWEFPRALYDVAGFGGDNVGIEDPGGWDTEGEGMGFGAGPVFLVRFAEDLIVQKYLKQYARWSLSAKIREVI